MKNYKPKPIGTVVDKSKAKIPEIKTPMYSKDSYTHQIYVEKKDSFEITMGRKLDLEPSKFPSLGEILLDKNIFNTCFCRKFI